MVAIIKEILLKMILLVMENIIGKMANLIKDNGAIVKWMVKELHNGLMERDMKEIIKMIKNMGLVFFNGKMEGNMKVNG